jgi:hypothetical protein
MASNNTTPELRLSAPFPVRAGAAVHEHSAAAVAGGWLMHAADSKQQQVGRVEDVGSTGVLQSECACVFACHTFSYGLVYLSAACMLFAAALDHGACNCKMSMAQQTPVKAWHSRRRLKQPIKVASSMRKHFIHSCLTKKRQRRTSELAAHLEDCPHFAHGTSMSTGICIRLTTSCPPAAS